MPWLSDLKNTLQKLGQPEKPRAPRRPVTGVTAHYGIGPATTPAAIKDISSSGIFLITQERPSVGELVTLMLRVEGDPEKTSELQFTLHARVVTYGEDGIGLAFVLPSGMDMSLWTVLLRNIVELDDPVQVKEAFRNLRMILFVCRLCQSEAEETIGLLGGQLDVEHTLTLFKIVFAAENQIVAERDAGRMRVHPKLLASILREGAWAPDDLIRQLWTGLLVSSCALEAPDDSNRIFVELLVHMTSTEGKIFSLACSRALAAAPGGGNSANDSIVLTPAEMARLTGVNDPYRNATDLAYLFNLGLIEKVFDFTSYHQADSFDITPSRLGLALYKHCHGNRDKIEPDILESATQHLANFLPSAQPLSVDSGASPSLSLSGAEAAPQAEGAHSAREIGDAATGPGAIDTRG